MPTSKRVAGGLLLLLAALTFALQSYNVGFWSFRHGWTSVHGLAIMSRSEPQNRFVGYSMMYRDANGAPVYEYFDRYPPFFSVSVNAVLALADDIPTEIYLARLYMNVFFVGALFFAYRLARLFITTRPLAVAVVALAFSSYYLLYYRDMIDFYQPVAMNFLVLAYAIARYRLYGERRLVLGVAAALTLVSFGYAMLFMLGVWFLVETVALWSRPGDPLAARLRGTVLQPPVYAICISLVLTVAAIGYNVATEAAVRGVPVAQTSVIDSILRRLPFVEGAVAETAREQAATSEGLRGWGEFLLVETERLMRWSLPLRTGGAPGVRFVPGISTPQIVWTPGPLRGEVTTPTTPPVILLNGWLLLAAVGAFALVVRFMARLGPPLRGVAVVVAFGGFPLVFGLINLTSVHDYTLMFATGFSVMLWTALLCPLDGRPALAPALAAVAIAVYGASAWTVRVAQTAEVAFGAPYTADFDRMRPLLADARHTVYLDVPRADPECVIRNWQCFALGYYLGDTYLTTAVDVAGYALSETPFFLPDPFVAPGAAAQVVPAPAHPQNTHLYLMDFAAAETRTAPEAVAYRFGDALGLGAWALPGPVTVRPCARVAVESWWTLAAPLAANYNLQVVMVGPDGGAVAEANRPLGPLPTGIWEVGPYTFDARSFVVPCATPPGAYPLIMGVYNPDDLLPLAVTGADGAPVGNQLYLTTLFVEGGA